VVHIITTKYPASARLKTFVGIQQTKWCTTWGNHGREAAASRPDSEPERQQPAAQTANQRGNSQPPRQRTRGSSQPPRQRTREAAASRPDSEPERQQPAASSDGSTGSSQWTYTSGLIFIASLAQCYLDSLRGVRAYIFCLFFFLLLFDCGQTAPWQILYPKERL
jgi:hypothetical protein